MSVTPDTSHVSGAPYSAIAAAFADDQLESGLQIGLRGERARSVYRQGEAGEQDEKSERWHVHLR